MSKIVHIGGDPNDPHYRYKRNIIEVTYTNKKGGMTKVTNFQLICKQLKVPVKEFSKGFYKKVKKTLGVQMVSQGMFKGNVSAVELEKILEKMIKKFILCKKCNLPELNVDGDCLACGQGKNATPQEDVEVQSVAELTSTMAIEHKDDLESHTTVFMRKLYDLRTKCENADEDYTDLDNLIDCCWKVTSMEQLQQLRKKLNM